jgi:hypothetical protein
MAQRLAEDFDEHAPALSSHTVSLNTKCFKDIPATRRVLRGAMSSF